MFFFCHCIFVYSITLLIWIDWEERSFKLRINPDWLSKDSTKRKENLQDLCFNLQNIKINLKNINVLP